MIDEKARLWSSSYKKVSQRRHLEKQDEDLSNLMTPEMVVEYEQSESARRAVSLINQLSGAHCLQINQAEYTLTRRSKIVSRTTGKYAATSFDQLLACPRSSFAIVGVAFFFCPPRLFPVFDRLGSLD